MSYQALKKCENLGVCGDGDGGERGGGRWAWDVSDELKRRSVLEGNRARGQVEDRRELVT